MKRALGLVLALCACAYDPAPGLVTSRREARQFECVRLTKQAAHLRFPGEVSAEAARSLADERVDALVCQPRFLSLDERAPRDEAILSTLRSQIDSLIQLASTSNPGTLVWYVDAFYPEQTVAAKIAGAAKVSLFEHGRAVSDRVPVLAAGDVAVISRMTPQRSYETACKRYFDEQILGEGDAFLGLMILDARETQLHAGVCQRGQWQWVQ